MMPPHRAPAGRLVFATHPMPRVEPLCARLRARGLQAWPLPSFGIEPADAAGLAAAAARLADYDWLVLVSPTAAQLLAAAVDASAPAGHGASAVLAGATGRPGPAEWSEASGQSNAPGRSDASGRSDTLERLGGCRIAVVGQGSLEALAERHPAWRARAVLPRGESDARSLLAQPALQRLAGSRVLLVRGEQGRDELAETLRARGARLDEVRAYRRTPAGWPCASIDALDAAVRADAAAAFVVSVSDAAAATRDALRARSPAHWQWACGQPVLAVHSRVAEQCCFHGWRDVRVAGAGVDALAGALESA